MTITTTPELIHLNPNEIEIEDSVRLDPRLDRDFLASIEEHGVLVPVLAVRIDGQSSRSSVRVSDASRQHVGSGYVRSRRRPAR